MNGQNKSLQQHKKQVLKELEAKCAEKRGVLVKAGHPKGTIILFEEAEVRHAILHALDVQLAVVREMAEKKSDIRIAPAEGEHGAEYERGFDHGYDQKTTELLSALSPSEDKNIHE